MRIDKEDKKIFRLLLQGPKKRKDLLKEISSEKVLERRLAKEKKYGLIHSPRWGWYELTKEGSQVAKQVLAATIIPKLTHPKLRKLINMLPLEQYRAFFRLVLDAVVGKAHLLSYFDSGWPTPIAFGPTQTLKTTLAEIICYLLGLNLSKNIYLVPTAAPRELSLRHERTSEGFKAVPSSYFHEIFVTLDECNDPPSQGVKNSIFFFLDDRREFPVEDKLVTKKCCALLTFNMEAGLGGLRAFGIKNSHIRRSIPLDTSSLRGRLNKPTSVARKLRKYLSSPSGPRLDIHALRPRITKLPDKYHSLLEKLLFSHVEKDSPVSSYPLEILTLSRLMLVEPNVPVEDVLRSVVYDFLLCVETLGITKRGWKEKFSQLTTKEEKEDQERISELPEIEEEKEPTQALPATEEARMEEETKKVQDKLRISTEFWPQYKKLMAWVEAGIDEIQDIQKTKIWQFFAPEKKDEILIIIDAFKVVKEHFGKIEEGDWGGLKAFKSAVSDLEKRISLPLREICGKGLEKFMIEGLKEIKNSSFITKGKWDADKWNAGKEFDHFITNHPILTEEQKRKIKENFPEAYKAHKKLHDIILSFKEKHPASDGK